MENQAYYDAFSEHYEDQRDQAYHTLVDELEVGVVARYAQGARVLEAGCGTGLILSRLQGLAREVVGVDLSRGMLGRAAGRGLPVAQAELARLPFTDGAFDVVCSFKVLAHVEGIGTALAELGRVTRPGGHLLLEFYNPLSLRYLVKRLKRPSRIARGVDDEQVYTRYDTLWDIEQRLPRGLVLEGWRGIRVVTPFAAVHQVAGLRQVFGAAERWLADTRLGQLGGFVVAIIRKVK
jgi:SAM-dependent methyltransferase